MLIDLILIQGSVHEMQVWQVLNPIQQPIQTRLKNQVRDASWSDDC